MSNAFAGDEEAIETSFGSLRHFRAGDEGALVRYANNPKVARMMRDAFPHPYGPDDAQRFLAIAARRPANIYAIATPDEAIGSIGVMPGADVSRLTGEVGYWLAEPFWGRGIVTEALAHFTRFVFDRFGLVRLYALPFADNPASARALEKAGYALEARLRASAIKEGVVLDQLVYAAFAPGGPPAPRARPTP